MSNATRFIRAAALSLILLLGAGALPVQAASLTPAQIGAIIGLLQSFGADTATIGKVSAALNYPTQLPSPPRPQCHTFTEGLGTGMTGGYSDLYALQQVLKAEGFPFFSSGETGETTGTGEGYFGSGTKSAVTGFQAKYGILQTGYVGPLTRAKLNQLYGCNPTAERPHLPAVVAPVISGISGPTSLQVGQQGTWTVNASDPYYNKSLLYKVEKWGDEAVLPPGTPISTLVEAGGIYPTFTHTYHKVGTYAPIITVTNNSGQSATTSISVYVKFNIPAL